MRATPTKCWMPVRPSGSLAFVYARSTRKAAIESVLDNFSPIMEYTWRKLRRDGWRIVRVSCKEM